MRVKLPERITAMILAFVLVLSSAAADLPVSVLAEEETAAVEAVASEQAETSAPETKAPETSAPETKAPETSAPETKAPETSAPETNASETSAPETNASETSAPETKAPETSAPETNAPDTVPETEPAQSGMDTAEIQGVNETSGDEPDTSEGTQDSSENSPETEALQANINLSAIELEPGESQQLQITANDPTAAFTLESKNPDAATVQGGSTVVEGGKATAVFNVTAIAEGTAVLSGSVTRKKADGSTETANVQCTVNVGLPKAEGVTISVSQESAGLGYGIVKVKEENVCILREGSTLKLKADVSPEKASQKIKWSSSDSNVVTVTEDGIVTKVNAGIATVTAAAESDENVKDTLKIIVPELKLNVSDTSVMMLPGKDIPMELTGYETYKDYIKAVTWSVDDNAGAGYLISEDVSVTGTENGKRTVTAKKDGKVRVKVLIEYADKAALVEEGGAESSFDGKLEKELLIDQPTATVNVEEAENVYPGMEKTLTVTSSYSAEEIASIDYKVSPEGAAEIVEEEGTRKIKFAESAQGTVSVSAAITLTNDYVISASADVVVKEKIPLKVEARLTTPKTYDGTTNLPNNSDFEVVSVKKVVGTETENVDELKGNIEIESASAAFEKPDAAAEAAIKGVSLSWAEGTDAEISCVYTLEPAKAYGKINRKEISVTLPDATQEYTKIADNYGFSAEIVEQADTAERVRLKDSVIQKAIMDSGIGEKIAEDDVNAIKENKADQFILSITGTDDQGKAKSELGVGTYTVVLENYANEEKKVELGSNYILKYTEGTFTVASQDDFKLSDIQAGDELFQVKDTAEFWMQKDGTAIFTISNEELSEYYDKVYVEEIDNVDLNETGIKNLFNQTGEVTLNIYLGNSKMSETRSNSVEITIKQDDTAPNVKFESVGSNNESGDQTYNIFNNTPVSVAISASDDESGIGTAKYYVLRKDENSEDVTYEKLKDDIAAIPQDSWTELKEDNGYQATVEPDTEGYYIIVVDATDHVGNGNIYTSNGFVYEKNPPEISDIILAGTKKGDFYTDTVSVSASVTDAQNLSTGVKEIKYIISKDGVETPVTVLEGVTDTDLTISDMKTAVTWPVEFNLPKGEYDSNDLSVEIRATDLAGNEASKKVSFKIDITAPVIKVGELSAEKTKPDVVEKDGAATSCYDGAVTLVITFTEKNFDPSEASVTIKVNGAEKTLTADALDALKESDGISAELEEKGDVHKLTLTFENDGTYAVTKAECRDKADWNTVEKIDYHFLIDKDSPELEFKALGRNKGAEGVQSYNAFHNTQFSETITVSDKNSGIDQASYCVFSQAGDMNGIKDYSYLELAEKIADLNTPWTSIVTSPDGNYVETATAEVTGQNLGYHIIAVKVKDNSGNETIYTSNGFVYEQSEPVISDIILSGKLSENGEFYKSAVSVSADVKDAETLSTRVNKVTYTISKDGTKRETESETEVSAPDGVKFENLTISDMKTIVTWPVEFDLPKGEYDSNDLSVEIKATDLAGNEASKKVSFKIDTIAPVIKAGELSAEKTEPDVVEKDGAATSCYNGVVTLVITFTEKNFVASKASVTLMVDGTEKTLTADALNALKESDGISAELKNDGDVHKLTLTFKNDGTYAVTKAECTDKADWNTGKDLNYHFLIDTKEPEVLDATITSTASADGFYSSDVLFNINAGDSNSGLDEVWYEVWKTETGQQEQTQEEIFNVEGYENSHEYNANKIFADLNNCNDVILKVSVKDHSGNVAVKEVPLKIDNKKPVITVEYEPKTGTYFKNTRKATITVKERNFDPGKVTFSVKGSGNATPQFDDSGWSNGAYDKDDTEHKYVIEFPQDGTYTVAFFVKDRADNEASYGTDTFIIDKKSPTFDPLSLSGTVRNDIYSGDVKVDFSAADIITNESYSGIAEMGYDVYVNGSKREEESHKWTYTDGRRTAKQSITITAKDHNSNEVKVVAYVKDRAGNISRQEKKFAIDITKPKMTVEYDRNSPRNGRYYNAVRTATVKVWERNFDADGVKWTVSNTDGTKPSFSKWSHGKADGDNTLHTCTITYRADGDYSFTMSVTDMAGNQRSLGRTDTFTIDRTAPVVTVTYTNNGSNVQVGRSEGTQIYKQGSITMHVRIVEHNFQAGKDVVWTANGSSTGGGFSSSGNVRTGSVTFSRDAHYVTNFSYTDLAGNRANVIPAGYFTVDNTAPVNGRVAISPFGSWNRFSGFTHFSKAGSLTATITGSDALSGPPEISWHKSSHALSASQLAGAGWTSGSSVRVSSEEQFIIYARLRDKAGNTSYVSSDGVILDRSIEKPVITITTRKPAQNIYNGDVSVNIRATDPSRNSSYSGLKSVRYEVLNNGTVTQRGTIPVGDHQSTVNQTIKVDSTKNNSNNVTVKAYVEDNAGNTESAEQKIEIDTTKPEISVSYDLNTPKNGSYYGAVRTATVTIKERNFDESGVEFNITNTDGSKPAISRWRHSGTSGVSDSTTHTCTVTFAEDGDYTFTLSAKDKAGNSAEYTKKDEFTIDRTEPVIRVTYDRDDAENGNYYKNAIKATITVEEHNFDKNSITVVDKGSSEEIERLVFTDNGDIHTATLSFSRDGYYAFNIEGMDLAGNEAKAMDDQKFYVDKVKPVIKISGVQAANKGKVQPVIEISDDNYDPEGVVIKLVGLSADHKTTVLEPESRTDTARGTKIVLKDVDYKKSEDDFYTLTVEVTDKAGNKNSEKKEYSVNRFGSVYDFDEYTQGVLSDYYVQMPEDGAEDIVVYEINVDTLKRKEVQLSLNGQVQTLTEGEDYQVDEEKEDGRMTFTYHILRKNFAQDGKYALNIYSQDAAGNESSNQGQEKDIEFVVDNTAPTVVVTGIDTESSYAGNPYIKDGGSYNETGRTVTVDVKDNIQIQTLKIEVYNGEGQENLSEEETRLFEREELEENYGVVTIDLKESNRNQYINVVATDMAGNQLGAEGYPVKAEDAPERNAYRVLITTNPLVRWMQNKPLFYGTIIAAAALALLIIWLIRRRKKEQY